MMPGLLVPNLIEHTRLQKYHRLKASGSYSRDSNGACPSCLIEQVHADTCPRLLQIAGFHWNFRLFPSFELADQHALSVTLTGDAPQLQDPFLHFPPELSSLILFYSVDDPNAIMQVASCRNESYFGPIKLALVCRRWHALAFSEPRLWSTLVVIVVRPMPVDAVHVVEACLRRSGGVPLNIVFTAWDPYISPELVTSCVKAICNNRARWSDVALNVHRTLLQEFVSTARPHLTNQKVHVQTFSEDEAPPIIGAVRDTALRPTHFVYTERDQVHRGYVMRLPILWTHLHFLDLSGITIYDLIHLLGFCPRISVLSVSLRDEPADVLSKPSSLPLRLQHLIALYLTVSCSSQSVIKFFRKISAPHITTLAVMNRTITDNEHIPLDVIIALLERSGNTELTSLYLTGPCYGSQLVRLLKSTPKLVTLDISNSPFGQSAISDEFWAELAVVDTSTECAQFLPELATFHYIGPLAFCWSFVANACDVRMARPWGPEADSRHRTITSLVLRSHNGFTHDPTTLLDRESLQRFLELPRYCLDISNICLVIDPVLLERSIVAHRVAVDHDVGLYYCLPESLALYY